jgi:hypothetical protein
MPSDRLQYSRGLLMRPDFVVVKVFSTSTMLSQARRTWMAFAIMADATKVPPSRIGEEDVGTEVDGLSRSLKASASARKFGQIHRTIDRDKDIDIFRDRLGCYQQSQE